jgi:hypothetical protein
MQIDLPAHTVIDEHWLKSVGFKWHQFDRQPNKQWLLWLGSCQDCPDRRLFSGAEDIGIELARSGMGDWFCWFRSDVAGRYHRFIHVRHMTTTDQVIRLVEAISGLPWNPDNHIYGVVRCTQCANALIGQSNRLDLELLRRSSPWTEHEKDESRSRPLIEHVDAAIKGGLAK